jgi:hypothetical protein
MQRICSFALIGATLAFALALGCGQQAPSDKSNPPAAPNAGNAPNLAIAKNDAPVGASSQAIQQNPPQQDPAAQAVNDGDLEKYNSALMAAIDLMGQQKLPEALTSLEGAARFNNTEFVQIEIKKLRFRIDRQQAADKMAVDIQAVLDQGDAVQAAKLAADALKEFGASDAAPALVKLKLQADALALAQTGSDPGARKTFVDQGQAALDAGNSRAAVAAFDQALALGDDAQLKQRADDLRAKLAKYDENRARAAELRRDPATLDDAIALLKDAGQQWDTVENRQDLDDYNLALQNRKDRVAVADFEVRGEVGVAGAGQLLADELLPNFKVKFELVERGQIGKVLDDLKLGANALGDEEQRQIGELVKARYLVLGSITQLDGLLVNARLVEARSGAIVQTAKITAANPIDLVAQAPLLARLLLMTDQEQLAYQQDLIQKAAAVEPVQIDQPLPPPPAAPAPDQAPPPPIVSNYTPAPNVNNFVVQDFQNFQQAPVGQPFPPVAFGGDPELMWQRRAARVSLEVGDNLFLRGNFVQARQRFSFGLALDTGFLDVQVRLGRCDPFIPPVQVQVIPPPALPRVAVLGFAVFGDPGYMPPGFGYWSSQQFAPYLYPPYEVVDPGLVNWWMARMGMTVRDVVQDPYARRWLGRALNIRYFVFGNLVQTASFDVNTYMVDAEYGFLTGQGYIHARTPYDLRWRLGELAQMMMQPPGTFVVMQRNYREYEILIVKAQEARNRGQFDIAIAFLNSAAKLRPSSLEVRFYLGQWNDAVRRNNWEQQRRKDFVQFQTVALERKMRAQSLTIEADRQHKVAIQQAAAMGPQQKMTLEKNRLAAFDRLVAEARAADRRNEFGVSVQRYESALSLRQSDEVSRELANARAQRDRVSQARLAEAAKQREVQSKQLRDQQIAIAVGTVRNANTQRDTLFAAPKKAQEDRDQAEYARLIAGGRKSMADAKFAAAVSTFMAAKQLKKTEEVEALLQQATVAQAKVTAAAKGPAVQMEFDQKLAQDLQNQQKAEAAAKLNREKYASLVDRAKKAYASKSFEASMAAYEEAGRIFKTDEVLAGWNQAKAAADKMHAESAGADKKTIQDKGKVLDPQQQKNANNPPVVMPNLEAQKKKTEYDALLANGKKALDEKRYAEAIKTLTEATALLPGDKACQDLLKLAHQQQQISTQAAADLAANQQKFKQHIDEARKLIQAKKLDDAAKAVDAAAALSPKDAQVSQVRQELDQARRAQTAELDAAKKKSADQLAIQKKQADFNQLMNQGNGALAGKKYPDAVKFFGDAAKLMPGDQSATKALKTANDQWEAAKGPPPPSPQQKAEYDRQMQLGLTLDKQKKWDDAIKAYDAALKQIPKDGKAQESLNKATFNRHLAEGNRLIMARRFPDAVREFEAALKLYPKDTDAAAGLKKAKDAK